MFAEVEELDFPQLEGKVLQRWEKRKVFDQLRAQNERGEPYSFIDGPITANNLRGLGLHHAWGRTYKDIFQRYQAMQGRRLRYQNGFDCQGLWVEVEVEKELGLQSKRDILAYGMDRFADQCRQRVEKSARAIEGASRRLGQWMDWDHSYYTHADGNIEHIWHFLQVCHGRDWLYKGHRVMPWCVRCGTSLSQHELADAYKEVTHRAVYVQLPLLDEPGASVLVWTTTPWTLAANSALAVHPQNPYVRVEKEGAAYYAAEEVAARLVPGGRVVARLQGGALVGRPYAGPFDNLPVQAGVERRIVPWDQVGAEEGTGVVHIAPGCGAEDYELGRQKGLAVLAPLDEDGVYVDGYGALSGRDVLEALPVVLTALQEAGVLYRAEDYQHRYPHCWRCGTELVFRLVDEWFIACDEVRQPMLKAAAQVRWVPGHAGLHMADWLRNMGDWCISRKRYWGLPLPFYQSGEGELAVLGSRRELAQRAVDPKAVETLPHLHRPWIDAVEVRLDSGAVARRVPEVGDCWLDAGIVPFSTLNYLGGKREEWARWCPAELVAEMREQVRLWFYSMLFMGVTLEGRAPYRTVLTHEKMHDEQGRPMHKSAGNALWFDEAVEHTGAEPWRWLFAGQNPSLPLDAGYGPAGQVKRRLLTLWHTYRFFVQYARIDQVDVGLLKSSDQYADIDRWLLARLHILVGQCRTALDAHDLPSMVRAVEAFVDELSNWYVRLNRRRFWKGAYDADKLAAYSALYETLATLCRLLAPVMPFLSEAMYQNLVAGVDPEAPESVHLCPYPQVEEKWVDRGLVAAMEAAQQVVRLGHALRSGQRLKVRQPLARLLVAAPQEKRAGLEGLAELIVRELNVKEVQWVESEAAWSHYTLKPNFRTLGRKFGRCLPQVQAALAQVDAEAAALSLKRGEGVAVRLEGETVLLDAADVKMIRQSPDYLATADEGGWALALDTRLTDELVDEGLVREFVHYLQGMRKEAGLAVDDRMVLRYRASDRLAQVLTEHAVYVRAETLCLRLEEDESVEGPEVEISDEWVRLELRQR